MRPDVPELPRKLHLRNFIFETWQDVVQCVELARQAGLGDARDFWWSVSREAERTGTWIGTSLELWVTLFTQHRAVRHGGTEPQPEEPRRLDELCRTLRRRLLDCE